MTWKEAIRKVLQEEGGPLHYTDITSRIFENGYRKKEECGATPDQTVCAQLATKKDMFLKLGNGIYKLADKSETIADKQSETKEDRKQIAEEEKLILKEPPTGFLDCYLTHSQLLNSSKNPILGHFCPVFVPVQEGLILGQTGPYRDVT